MIRDVLPFLCARLFARCLINLFGRQQSGKEKREVKGISFTKNGDFIGGRFNRWARLFIFKRAPYSRIKALCGRQSIRFFSKIFQILKRTICDWAFLYYWSTIYQRPTISDCADGLYFNYFSHLSYYRYAKIRTNFL